MGSDEVEEEYEEDAGYQNDESDEQAEGSAGEEGQEGEQEDDAVKEGADGPQEEQGEEKEEEAVSSSGMGAHATTWEEVDVASHHHMKVELPDAEDEQADEYQDEQAGRPAAAGRGSAAAGGGSASSSYSLDPDAAEERTAGAAAVASGKGGAGEDASLDATQVQASHESKRSTQRYLQMLRSGALQSPRLPQLKAGADGATDTGTDRSRAASVPKHAASLTISDLVSPEVEENILRRTRKVLTPGPGAYEPRTDRHGRRTASCRHSFGTARQRLGVTAWTGSERVASPGPVYLPRKDALSTLSHPNPQLSFPRQEVGTRFSLGASMPTNCPHWNPGPGQYDTRTIYKGGSLDPNDGPKWAFPQGSKLTALDFRLARTAIQPEGTDSAAHALGPAFYTPDLSLTKPTTTQYSLLGKGPSYFDAFGDPAKQRSPGPVYDTCPRTYRGFRPWGDEPRTVFGRAKKQWEPEVSLSATAFISKVHAHHSNQLLHSPGPIYYPELTSQQPSPGAKAPVFASGPPDRFYDRFEPGRMV